MENSKVLIYDGSFNGYLTSLYVALKENMVVSDFQKLNTTQNGLFVESKMVVTQISKAKEVWTQIEKKGNTIIRNVYFAFLSEADGIEYMLYNYVQGLFRTMSSEGVEQSVNLEHKIVQLAKMVSKEKHLMEAEIEFENNNDRIHIVEIEPGYNVLPLISRFFRFKHSKHQWIIFDRKRNYGLYYNLSSVEIINSETKSWYMKSSALSNTFSQNEYRFAV
ncbi:TIGR03915 family putative DNA repair protein [Maribacter sp. HTCC2170]|uniref:TIGR03915 family putative DNA repair protein n=1 Tax=Maribacter sp. (strain HTCC2170 / KCCM 42371) TaxID=313603 RepID=UPI00006AFC7C|nr:TIGR03915 family putative DNA repair protein [Maribacter sp. HTCC2170]EAR01467.1 hypothetical protein FB2170_12121 [Maribacter sp. HTCC2170]